MNYKIKKYIRELSHKDKRLNKIYKISNKIKTNAFKLLNDKTFAKIKYKENTGKKLDLINPKTFNEKVWWLKLNNRDPLLTTCSDKVLVREYVKSVGLSNILNPIFGVYDTAEEIIFKDLPDQAYIKTNNGSGTNILWDSKRIFDFKKFNKTFSKALKNNYYYESREWNYKNIEPKIIVDQVIESESEVGLVDYRFLCFDGKVKLIYVDIATASEDGSHSPYAKRNVYDPEFNVLDVKVTRENFSEGLVQKPKNLDTMIKYAETLSKPFPFCRVDFYNESNKIIFGEITFYPGGGTQILEPSEWEEKLGSWINLKSTKIQTK